LPDRTARNQTRFLHGKRNLMETSVHALAPLGRGRRTQCAG
jgi:hypothetical protein